MDYTLDKMANTAPAVPAASTSRLPSTLRSTGPVSPTLTRSLPLRGLPYSHHKSASEPRVSYSLGFQSQAQDPLGPSSSNALEAARRISGISGSPTTSPSRSRRADKIYGDRFIPNREGLDLSTSFQLLQDAPRIKGKGKRKAEKADLDLGKEEANRTFNAVLKTELFGSGPAGMSSSNSLPVLATSANNGSSIISNSPRYSSSTSGHPITNPQHQTGTPPPIQKNLFSFSSPNKRRASATSGVRGTDSPTSERYSLSPVSFESQRLLLSPRKTPRALSKVPYKVLDAPELADDFYLNLVDWSATDNLLGVGLGSCVYLWSAATAKVTKLCDLNKRGGGGASNPSETVTSVAWIDRGSTIAIGTSSGSVQLWDAAAQKEVRQIRAHQARVGALAWNDWILSSGSRDRMIYHRDVRAKEPFFRRLAGHKQEVCGLKWSPDGSQLASGGNDNKLLVWEGSKSEEPLWRFHQHTAAVKAIAWNPMQSGILASGGGTADKKIRFWNSLTGNMLSEIDTGSQICNLLFSATSSELVSTHGYSGGPVSNQVCIWKYPSMQKVATLTGHTYRVLYLAASPDGRTIVTGAGDETLRFWDCFRPAPKQAVNNKSPLDPAACIR